MSEKPWSKFIVATGKEHELNMRIGHAIDLYVEHATDYPTTLILGRELIKDLEHDWSKSSRYWGSYVGELKLILVEGCELMLVRGRDKESLGDTQC